MRITYSVVQEFLPLFHFERLIYILISSIKFSIFKNILVARIQGKINLLAILNDLCGRVWLRFFERYLTRIDT